MAAKTLAETVYFYPRDAMHRQLFEFGEMEFGEMKRNALSMPLSDP